MKILLAIDSFKESMTSLEAAAAFARGFKKGMKGVKFTNVSISDGGEGFTESLIYAGKGRIIRKSVHNAVGRRTASSFGLFDRGKSAVVEMAKASGLQQLKPGQRNPLKTSTFGTGELIAAALNKGVKKLIVGIGGSATNDGGIGMAQALGVSFYDKAGRPVKTPAAGEDLLRIARIDLGALRQRLKGISVVVACDVNNPMTGKNGAAYVYGPQKGATPAMVRQLDSGLKNLSRVIQRDLGKKIERFPGAGAAGGLGGGLMAFLNARLKPGIDIMLDTIRFDNMLKGIDLVVTGEGSLDAQTVNNKAPVGVARVARRKGIPVIALCGTAGPGAEKVYPLGIRAIFPIVPGPVPLNEAIAAGKTNMMRTAENIARLIKCGKFR